MRVTSSAPATAPRVPGSSPDRAPGRSPSRFLLPLGLGIVLIVVLEAAFGSVGFATHGRGLVLLLSTVAYAAAAAVFLTRAGLAPRWSMGLLTTMAVAVLVMHAADPEGPVIGLFVIAAFTPLRPPQQVGTVILVACTALYNVEQLLIASETVLLTLATDAGAAFFYLLGTSLRREREQRERVDQLVIELEASREAERAAVAEVERSRMAREVHDVLAHTLSGLSLQLEAARLLAGESGTDPRLQEAVGRAHRLAKSGLVESRRAVAALRGDALPGADQVHDLVNEHRLATGGVVTVTETGTAVDLPPDAGLTLYRAVQEALSNVRKHAPDADVSLVLAWGSQDVTLTVTDDGGSRAGTSATAGAVAPAGTVASADHGYGLAGMAERAALAGGEVTAAPFGSGFRVSLRLPFSEAADERR
ncbi:Histidine kinase-, DNA gyrase B-, and HSP90-like ATPase [Pedococcus cremeus]|uniref:histidine kinase n=1 Tax=Pedococcus cremeus TaxID=587636 RepID=A0A1H9XWI5_9MICO|nr:Histidine kinase-, DNA gyrase B-, and HSP90-like ATPase [Pedococcus cremeus]